MMQKKKKQPIYKRDTDIPTNYRTTGHTRFIQNIGEVLSKIQRLDEDGKIESTYLLGAVTKYFLYYLDKEYDNEYGTIMINKRRHLIADHFLASNDLEEIVAANNGILWMSRTVKVWQREQYISPHLLTPDVKKWLNKVNIDETLTKQQKKVYYAFLNNGPVKYTKAEALMAVLSNVEQFPDLQLIPQKLLGNE
jgi:hypothetical protein